MSKIILQAGLQGEIRSTPMEEAGLPLRRSHGAAIAHGESPAAPDLRDVIAALPAAVYTTDADGRITLYNEAAVELWGHRPKLGTDEWCGSWRLYSPDGRFMPHDQCPMAQALKQDRPIRGAEAVAERPDGTRIPFLAFPTPLHDEAGALVGAVNMLVDITERKRFEQHLELLMREVDHRSNNLLSVVQAMLRFTRAETVGEYVTAFAGRIEALASAHSLLSESRWKGAGLGRLIEQELAPYRRRGEQPRMEIAGPDLILIPSAAQAMAMIVHELATNAAKYGALSSASGRLAIQWSRSEEGDLQLRWDEAAGPPIQSPVQQGFGTKMIERAIHDQLGGAVRFDWRTGGLLCELVIPASALAARGAGAANGSGSPKTGDSGGD